MGNDVVGVRLGEFIHTETVANVLGLRPDMPLQIDEMLHKLRVTFYEANPISNALKLFFNTLQSNFQQIGIEVIPYDEALNEAGKVNPNIAVFVTGMNHDDKDMMVNRVSSLYKNPIIGIYENDCPVKSGDTNQEKLDAIVSVLAYDVVHIAIFVNADSWTICTMNGAIIQNSIEGDLKETILNSLVPKLTAQVIPPNILGEIAYQYDMFDPKQSEFSNVIEDVIEAAKLLKEDGLIMSHTSVSSLEMKSKFHERIVKSYLDQRTGMSYGFMVWQLPIESKPAVLYDEISASDCGPDGNCFLVSFLGKQYLIEIPEVWVLSTRSGCDKTNLNLSEDIVRMGLSEGRIFFDLPVGVDKDLDVKPSYDTLAILAHAMGNSVISSLLKTVVGENEFSRALDNKGVSLLHWHGYLEGHEVPAGHMAHGEENPSVSCSTPQSAVYSFIGKIEALEASLIQKVDFLGDVHIEPHHGTNISSVKSLSEVVKFLRQL